MINLCRLYRCISIFEIGPIADDQVQYCILGVQFQNTLSQPLGGLAWWCGRDIHSASLWVASPDGVDWRYTLSQPLGGLAWWCGQEIYTQPASGWPPYINGDIKTRIHHSKLIIFLCIDSTRSYLLYSVHSCQGFHCTESSCFQLFFIFILVFFIKKKNILKINVESK